jgi:hypothetical protein
MLAGMHSFEDSLLRPYFNRALDTCEAVKPFFSELLKYCNTSWGEHIYELSIFKE